MLGNLPEESTSFVGRNWELFRLDRALRKHRIVTLVGPGGVGKTRLALRAAHQVAEGFTDGVAWVELSPLYGDRLLLASVSDACDLADHTPRMPVDALCEWLTQKRLLLVLDSCEHLVDPVRVLIGDLLTAVPGLTVLATSRQPLGLEDERLIDLEPLPVDGPDALELFTQRVLAAGGFVPPESEPSPPRPTADGGAADAGSDAVPVPWSGDGTQAARWICRRLDGIPLALELAAAHAGRTSVAEVAERLTSRFDVLEAEAGLAVRPERHRTMLTTIGWSHELCAPIERLLWARLTVFRGDFDETSALAVCAGGPLDSTTMGPLLERLVSMSVLRVVKAPDGDGIRYRMLDTIREYGELWLRALEEDTVLAQRHAEYFLRFALRADREWLGPEQARWYRRISAAYNELCAALEHFLTHSPERALRLAGLVGFFWSCCGHLHEARDYLQQTLDAHPRPGPDRTRGLWALGVTTTLQGDYETARRVSNECTASAAGDQETEGILAAAYLAGLIDLLTGSPLDAEATSVQTLRAAGGQPFDSAARLRCSLVKVFALTGLERLDEARELALSLRAGCVERGESWTRAYLDYQLSLIALFRGDAPAAAAHARAMLEGKHGIGDNFGIALGLDALAAAISAAGDGERVGQVYGTGQAFWSTVGHPQRGTPELRAVRETCERVAREGVGDAVYERAYQEGASYGLDAGLKAALGPPSC
ncbi:ATP-binding protein [Streptomyces qinzhouensis]|uniref:Regulator n=1 Tax=Streptomyces qinzhouensis TaxID=2599401 RepID=A0A5B8JFZ7_9ACTN|nr:NB-ARC domain-containing protein [Streptomyces qinzhouensis]QDY80537.1 regulator [Streptomyces qinzhouensis]